MMIAKAKNTNAPTEIEITIPKYKLLGEPRKQKGSGNNYVQRFRLERDSGRKVRSVSLGTTDLRIARRTAEKAVEDKLREAAMADMPTAKNAVVPLQKHLDSWEEHHEGEHNSEAHYKQAISRVRNTIEALGWTHAKQIERDKLKAHIAKRQKAGDISPQTAVHYLVSFKAFTSWMQRTKKIATDPLNGMETHKGDIKPTFTRRSFTDAEFKLLIQNANASGVTFRGFCGRDRAMLYVLARATGLRAAELASLTASSFHLLRDRPYIKLDPTVSKRRRNDVIQLPKAVALRLRSYIEQHECQLWPGLWYKKSTIMMKLDMSGIVETTSDGLLSFHSLRHTKITDVVQAGANILDAMALARVSCPELLERYYHPDNEARTKTIEAADLPVDLLTE